LILVITHVWFGGNWELFDSLVFYFC